MRIGFVLIVVLVVFGGLGAFADVGKPLPAWIIRSIHTLRNSRSRDVIEEETYRGQRVFEFTSGTRFDTGDEHTLFGEDAKKICQFGGFVGHVTSGSCDIDKITYVRTIYSGTPRP